jgi:tRNA threonylcarbamoyl adenosine modification protein (Sua5/YciO/YrdC/YwlC family)
VATVYDCASALQKAAGFTAAKEAFARSGLVVLPTDTVYGLAADAFDPAAARRLLRAKGRGRSMPIPVLVGGAETLEALTMGVSATAHDLAEAFWPGGLTLICRQQRSLRWDLGDSRGTVAVRMPNQPVALDLLAETGPLAVSSANLTAQPPATTVAEAQAMLGDAVDVYLDDGPTPGLVPSSIVDVTGLEPRLVRLGVLSLEELRVVAPTIEAVE